MKAVGGIDGGHFRVGAFDTQRGFHGAITQVSLERISRSNHSGESLEHFTEQSLR